MSPDVGDIELDGTVNTRDVGGLPLADGSGKIRDDVLIRSDNLQDLTDVDDDGWADLPHYGRVVVRPRVFWQDGKGRSFFGTVGLTRENREGGTTGEGTAYETRLAHVEALDTRRLDGGFGWRY